MAIAIFLIFLVTALVVNQPWENDSTIPDDIKLIQDTVLNKIETDERLRECLVQSSFDDDEDASLLCIGTNFVSIDKLIPDTMYSALQLCWDETCPLDETIFDEDENYKKKTIYADSLIIQEQNYLDEPQIAVLRLFLWRKIE